MQKTIDAIQKTFYRYYDVLDGLLAELQGIMSQEYIKRVENYRIPEELDKINREFFLYSVEKAWHMKRSPAVKAMDISAIK